MLCSCTAGAAPYNDPYRLYNLDVFEYLEDHPFGLYGSIPVMLGHKKGLTVGVFWWVEGVKGTKREENSLHLGTC